jgi:hypothetical protein
MPLLATHVRLVSLDDIEGVLSSWLRLLTLTSVTIGTGLLPEHERREREARIYGYLSGCRCLESGLGMLASGCLYALTLTLFPAVGMSTLWTNVLAVFGVAAIGGAVGRIAGHVAARRRVQRELRTLHGVIAAE